MVLTTCPHVLVCPAGLGEGEGTSSSAATARSAALRATELAAVCLQLYEAGGRTIHVPLPPDNGLIVIVRELLGKAGSSSAAPPTSKELREQAQLHEGAAEVAQALLEMILQQHQQVCALLSRRALSCCLGGAWGMCYAVPAVSSG